MRIMYGLKPGDRLTVMQKLNSKPNQKPQYYLRKCIVIQEYPYFIVADFGTYQEALNKAGIYCNEVLLWKGWL